MSIRENAAIGVVVTVGGAVLMSLEVAAFRIIGRVYGTALQETTTVIAVFLTAMSVGYYLGGMMVDRRPRASTLGYVLLLATPLILLAITTDGYLTEAIAVSEVEPAFHAFLATTLLFALPTTLLASISPIAVRLLSTETGHSGRVAGAVSAMSSVGSIGGTVITAFVLIDYFGSIRTTVLVLASATLMLALLLGLASLRRGTGRPIWMRAPAMVGALVALALGGFAFQEHRALDVAMTTAGARVIFEKDTPYHHIRVMERPPGVRDLFIDAQLQSNLRIGDPHLRGLQYEEYKHFARLVRPGIRTILAIGLGGGTSVRQFISYYPDVSIDAVEIDPVVVDVAQRFFDVVPSDRLRLTVSDGRVYLRRSSKRYDMITIDVYTRGRYGSTIPQHMVTEEFFGEVSDHLNDGGIVHFHSYVGRDSRFSRALFKTLARVFPSVVVLGETEFIASASPLHVDGDDLRTRTGSLKRHLPNFDERLATLRTTPPRMDDVPLLTDDFAPVDTLLRGVRAPKRSSSPTP